MSEEIPEPIDAAIAQAQAEVARAFQAWALPNEIAEPPLDWKWFGEICRRYSDVYEERDTDDQGGTGP